MYLRDSGIRVFGWALLNIAAAAGLWVQWHRQQGGNRKKKAEPEVLIHCRLLPLAD